MDKIGIITAIDVEFDSFNIISKDITLIEESPFKIKKTILNNKEIYIILSNAGLSFSSAATELLITKYNINLLLNFGIVGALRKDLNSSLLCYIKDIVSYDFDTDPIDHKGIGYYEIFDTNLLKVDENILNKALNINKLPTYRCASGNSFINDNKKRRYLNKKFNADICDMESISILLISILHNIPCLFIKGISDSFKGKAKEYNLLKDEVSLSCAKLIKDIINSL